MQHSQRPMNTNETVTKSLVRRSELLSWPMDEKGGYGKHHQDGRRVVAEFILAQSGRKEARPCKDMRT